MNIAFSCRNFLHFIPQTRPLDPMTIFYGTFYMQDARGVGINCSHCKIHFFYSIRSSMQINVNRAVLGTEMNRNRY